MEGQILGNRYELIQKIGGGGMSLVYKAKCRLLNRFVAVKIMRPEFTNDEEFVKRFRIEAQSAASLCHPNIVSIYDVGNDGSIHYIVMEYVDGVTLKEYINQKGALLWKEAVNIAIQICSAIEHAHRNHIVHRDIKPHNILLTKDGVAKVTDFGIARAVSASTITMVGSTIGSVHYFSPEQARGGFIDEKSDLYSMGIALYEMVTGRVPFDGETPVAIALKHIQVEPEQPVEYNSEIPKGVNDIIMKAIKKEQNKRYQTAPDLLDDLYRVLKEPYGGFVTEENVDNSPTRRIKVIGDESLAKKDEYMANQTQDKKKVKKNDKLTYWLAGITSFIIIAVLFYVGFRVVVPIIMPDNSFEVKNYVGRNIDSVKSQLEKAGINATIKEEYSDKIPEGEIISQSVGEGKTLKPGGYDSLVLKVSKGKELVIIPSYKGKDPRMTEKELNDNGLKTVQQDEFNDTIPSGTVIRTEPGFDEEVEPDTMVTIFISKGPEIKTTKVPNLVGLTYKEAAKLLVDARLTIGTMKPEGSNYVDKILLQSPLPDTEVNEDSPVDITFDENISTTKIIPILLNLDKPDDYGLDIKVRIVITPSDTGTPAILVEETKKKEEFPLNVQIPVPINGSTKVSIFLDNVPYSEFTQQAQ